ncbi:MAG TPA: glycosyltransferase family 87 protein [Dehalococcoidia bacterium]|nr:glycosyltransferase family 87 protein [Dehalococcoidia bacterium]
MRPRLFQVAAVIGLCVLIAMAAVHTLQPSDSLRDFATFVHAGRAYEDGLNPYVLYEEPDPASGIQPGTPRDTGSPNLNPPISIYPFTLMNGHNPVSVRNGLRVVSALIYAAVCIVLLKAYPWQRRPLVMLWLLAVAGFWYTLLLGQIYIPLFALGLGALLLIERGRNLLWAGLLVGLVVAIKPNFAIWPLFLLLAGQRKMALTSVAVAAAISLVPLLIEGPEIYSQWLDAARAYPRAAIAPNASMFGVATRLGIPEAGYVLAAGLIAAAAFYTWRWRLTGREVSAWSVMLTLFVGPLTWVGYTLFMLPLLLSRPRWGGWEVAVAATMLVPAGLGWPAGEMRLAGIVMLSGLILNDTLQARQAGFEARLPNGALAQVSEAA